MNFIKCFLLATLIIIAAVPAHASSLADQAVELPLQSITNFLTFCIAGPALGIAALKAKPALEGKSVLTVAEYFDFAGCVFANTATTALLLALENQSYIHPAWAHAAVPAVLLPLAILNYDLIAYMRGKKPSGKSEHFDQLLAIICAQAAIVGPLSGLATLGLKEFIANRIK